MHTPACAPKARSRSVRGQALLKEILDAAYVPADASDGETSQVLGKKL